jgi:hypothetical protein
MELSKEDKKLIDDWYGSAIDLDTIGEKDQELYCRIMGMTLEEYEDGEWPE